MNTMRVGDTIFNLDNVFSISLEDRVVNVRGNCDRQVSLSYETEEAAKEKYNEIFEAIK